MGGEKGAGPYQLEADPPVSPVHAGVVVAHAGGVAAARSAGLGLHRDALQRVRQGVCEAAPAASPGQEGAGGVVIVQVEERLLCDAVQLPQLLFNFLVPERCCGRGAWATRAKPWRLWASVSPPVTGRGWLSLAKPAGALPWRGGGRRGGLWRSEAGGLWVALSWLLLPPGNRDSRPRQSRAVLP